MKSVFESSTAELRSPLQQSAKSLTPTWHSLRALVARAGGLANVPHDKPKIPDLGSNVKATAIAAGILGGLLLVALVLLVMLWSKWGRAHKRVVDLESANSEKGDESGLNAKEFEAVQLNDIKGGGVERIERIPESETETQEAGASRKAFH